MKLLSLNIWAGRQFDELTSFISSHEKDVDVFCFQEVFDTPTDEKVGTSNSRANIFNELKKILPNHDGYFEPAQDYLGVRGINFELYFGIAMFIRKTINIVDRGSFFIRGYRNSRKDENYKLTFPYNLQYLTFNNGKADYTIAHFHGLWNGAGKTDTEERILQSKKIKGFTNGKNRLVLCGDFNLLPDTKSLAILEDGMINLIKTYGIKSTRSKLYEKPEKFADYTLVTPDIKVKSFEVPNLEASDHLPMILDFE